MAITLQQLEQAIEALEKPGAYLGILPMANAREVLRASGFLPQQHLDELHTWGAQQLLARLTLMRAQVRNG